MEPALAFDVVADFLHIAGQVCLAARALHSTPTGPSTMADPHVAKQLSADLAVVLRGLDFMLASANDDTLSACRKICLDLAVHLDRFALGDKPGSVALPELWPEPDFRALEERLRDLIHQPRYQSHSPR